LKLKINKGGTIMNIYWCSNCKKDLSSIVNSQGSVLHCPACGARLQGVQQSTLKKYHEDQRRRRRVRRGRMFRKCEDFIQDYWKIFLSFFIILVLIGIIMLYWIGHWIIATIIIGVFLCGAGYIRVCLQPNAIFYNSSIWQKQLLQPYWPTDQIDFKDNFRGILSHELRHYNTRPDWCPEVLWKIMSGSFVSDGDCTEYLLLLIRKNNLDPRAKRLLELINKDK
jgi:DNA-directed RNA polymerase subunit RPC12/RpoP